MPHTSLHGSSPLALDLAPRPAVRTARWLPALLLATALLHAPATRAQDACLDDDAGSACEDDAGVAPPPASRDDDAGTGPGDDGDGPTGSACSCEVDEPSSDDGRIHVCTQSFERDVCEDFACDRGRVRSRGCPGTGATLCCTMESRGLYAALYEDCEHPNCESGFRAQCDDFGGVVSDGPCPSGPPREELGEADDDGGLCSVARVGGRSGASSPALLGLALLLAAWAARLRRRRAG